jgi:hypothetical protein
MHWWVVWRKVGPRGRVHGERPGKSATGSRRGSQNDAAIALSSLGARDRPPPASLHPWTCCTRACSGACRLSPRLSRLSFLRSSIHPSHRHLDTVPHHTLICPSGLGTWFDSTSVTSLLSTLYAMQDRDENAHYKSRIISVVAATGIALAWYVCYNHLPEHSSPQTIISTSILI